MSKTASSMAKGIAIVMMLMHHLFMSRVKIAERTGGIGLSYAPFTERQIVGVSLGFKTCVCIFVFITAYGTYRNLANRISAEDRSNSRQFARYSIVHYVRLLMSLYAIMIPAMIFGAATGLRNPVDIYLDGKSWPNAVFYALLECLGMAKAFGTPTYNGTWWYLSLATFLIFVLPPLIWLVKRFGSLPLLIGTLLLPGLTGLDWSYPIVRHLPAAAAGLVFAQYDLFERMTAWVDVKGGGRAAYLRFAMALGSVLLLSYSLYFRYKIPDQKGVFETIGAIFTCGFTVFSERSFLKQPLDVLGKHSANIFMFHTFIMTYFFSTQLYSLHHWLLILTVFVLGCLALSWLLEEAKRLTHYREFSERVANAAATLVVGDAAQE